MSREQKPLTTLEWETHYGFPIRFIAGVDEVGRGCLAGPVVAAAVVLPPVVDFERDPWLCEVTDSKALKPERREVLMPLIQAWAKAWAVGMASPEEIDRFNIHGATHLAMRRAVEALSQRPDLAIIDGKFAPKGMSCTCVPIIKADLKCISVACASIIAKVTRDKDMETLDEVYPGYGLAVHKGYPTPFHKAALLRIGASRIHRRSFAPVAQVLARNLELASDDETNQKKQNPKQSEFWDSN